MIKFLPLGGAGEIGANCYYLNFDGTGVLLDCGMHPQKFGAESLPRFDLITKEPVDYVLISHAHQDHLTALPYLVQRHPYIKIITTPQTRALAELALHNSTSILKMQIDEEDDFKIYSHEEIDLLIKTIDYKSYKEKFNISGYSNNQKPLRVTFRDAGHILGSASILINYNDFKIFYTGDINLDNQYLLKGAELPNEKIDVLLSETTYGSTDSLSIPGWEEESRNFAESANKILNAGGSILIPVFSLGKMQEIAGTLWTLMEKNILTKTDIYTGGIANKITRIYDYNRYVVNMVNPNFELLSIPYKDIYEVYNPDNYFKSPSIVLAPSGMMVEGTVSFNLAKRWLKQKNSAIFTVGYMEENTPGYIIANAVKGDKIKLAEFDDVQEVKCEIKQFRFPSHSKREGLIEIAQKLKPDTVILLHGDPPAIDWVGANILSKFKKAKVYSAEIGKEIEL